MTAEQADRARRYLRNENHRWPVRPVKVARAHWPPSAPPAVAEVWRSRDYLVQVYREADGIIRLSIMRTMVDGGGDWADGISWEALQALKSQCGFGDRDAVEVYPCDHDVVNVANLRHLWILPGPLSFKWSNRP